MRSGAPFGTHGQFRVLEFLLLELVFVDGVHAGGKNGGDQRGRAVEPVCVILM